MSPYIVYVTNRDTTFCIETDRTRGLELHTEQRVIDGSTPIQTHRNLSLSFDMCQDGRNPIVWCLKESNQKQELVQGKPKSARVSP